MGDRYWVPHEELAFAPGVAVGTEGKFTLFQLRVKDKDAPVSMKVPTDRVKDLDIVKEPQLLGVEDVCTLEEVNQAALLHTLRARYSRDLIYTRVGRILIAANPFQWLPIFGPTQIDKYRSETDSMDLPAHIYSIGLDAVNGLQQGSKRSQAVLISGESGAGKTESTKLVLNYVGDVLGQKEGASGSDGPTISDNIMQTNPILESFGNAMTVRNNNSSRFGKWLQISVNGKAEIQGCSVTDYLLELTRVTAQGQKERGYHVFFQLIKERNDPLLKPLGLDGPEAYSYIKGAQHDAPGVNDSEFFKDMREAFTGLGFKDETQVEIFKLVMGILSMGNMEFRDNGDAAEFVDPGKAQKAADLLGIDVEELRKPMIIRKIFIGKDCTEANRTAAQARSARDSMARLMYGRLFKWLVEKINEKLGKPSSSAQFFGVLDIAGFESFEVNSLEQLFINLSNEHLQQHFNNFIFKMELADYAAEGVDSSSFAFADNKDIIDLLDEKGSILQMLDEELAMPKATDASFCARVFKAHDKHKRLIVPKFQGAVSFGIRHFAGRVDYDCNGFLEKNVDKPPDEAPGLLQGSSLGLLKELGDKIAKDLAEATAAAKGKKVKTVSAGFRTSLAALIQKVQDADPHFIRCLKPNQDKVPSKFTSPIALQQLIASGVYEALRIRQSGYSARILFKDFMHRYKMILPKPMQTSVYKFASEIERMTAFLKATKAGVDTVGGLPDSAMIMGKTKIFCRSQAIVGLDKAREIAILGYVVDLQRFARGFLARRMVKQFHKAVDELKAWSAKNNFYTKKGTAFTAMYKLKTTQAVALEAHKCDKIFEKVKKYHMRLPGKHDVEKVQHRMANEVSTIKHVKELEHSTDVMEIEKVLARVADLELPDMPEMAKLRAREAKLKQQVPLVNAIQQGVKEANLHMLEEALADVKKLGLHMHPEEWMDGCDGSKMVDHCYETIQQLKAKEKLEKVKKEQSAANSQKLSQEKANHNQQNVVKLEERDQSAQKPKKRLTITGLNEEAMTRIQLKLAKAKEEYSAKDLQAALSECVDHAVTECDGLEEGKKMFYDLEKEDYITAQIKRHLSICEQKGVGKVDQLILRILQNLVDQAKSLNVAEDAVAEAQPVMQANVRARARHTIKGTIFHDVDVDDLDLVEAGFGDLSTYPRLKKEWLGHRVAWRDRAIPVYFEMLTHTKHEIREALTQVPENKEKLCVMMFSSILGWMHDRPMPMASTHSFAQELVSQVESEHEYIADEVFVMMMKQLTNNPSPRSVELGWKLMLLLCHSVRPSVDLEEFLRAFLLKAVNDKSKHAAHVAPLAKQCIADLNKTPDKVAEHHAEDINVKVMLIDDSFRCVHAPPFCTLKELRNRICEQLRISHVDDYALYQHTEGLDLNRFLPEQAQIGTLLQKWKKLKEATGKGSLLIFKRLFMRANEYLNAGDLMHASLSYRQALWDYYRYPVSEDLNVVAQIAATILFAEYEHYHTFVEMNRLADPGVLEHFLPVVSVREQSRAQWAKDILSAYKFGFGPEHDGESRLQRMSRVVSVLQQKTKLFGCHYFMATQLSKLPADRALPESPSQMLVLNRQAPTASYWVCIDMDGVRFVATDSRPGNSFHRAFLFNEDAADRILCWGAKGPCVTLVVSGILPENVQAGRQPMTITLHSPASMDICFGLHLVHSKRP